MRKIKLKPLKRLSFKPPKGTVIAYVTPVEAAFLMQERYEEYARRKTWETIMGNAINLSDAVIKAHRINITAISLKESITS